jgi:hypothetical protein
MGADGAGSTAVADGRERVASVVAAAAVGDMRAPSVPCDPARTARADDAPFVQAGGSYEPLQFVELSPAPRPAPPAGLSANFPAVGTNLNVGLCRRTRDSSSMPPLLLTLALGLAALWILCGLAFVALVFFESRNLAQPDEPAPEVPEESSADGGAEHDPSPTAGEDTKRSA